MKKLLICALFFVSSLCTAQTRPSYLQTKDLPVFDIRQYGAKVDGSTNDVMAVRAAVDAASASGGGIVYFPNGTTSIKWRNGTFGDGYIPAAGMIEIKSNITFMGQSKAAIVEIGDNIFSQASSYIQPLFSDYYVRPYEDQPTVVNVAFKNLTLSGNAAHNRLATNTVAFYYLIRLTKAEGVTIEDCNFIDSNSGNVIIFGHIAWGYAPTEGAVKNVRISNCLFSECGQVADPKIIDHSTIFAAADDVLISDCRFENSVYTPIPGNWGRCAVELHGTNNTLEDSIIINYRSAVNSVAGFFDVERHRVINNYVPLCSGPLSFVTQWGGVGSQTCYPYDYATRTTSFSDLEIANNRVEAGGAVYFLYSNPDVLPDGNLATNINIHDNALLVLNGTWTSDVGAIDVYNIGDIVIKNNYCDFFDQNLLRMKNFPASTSVRVEGNTIRTRHVPDPLRDVRFTGVLRFNNPAGVSDPVLKGVITNNTFECTATQSLDVPFIYNECGIADMIVSNNFLNCSSYVGSGTPGLSPEPKATFVWQDNVFKDRAAFDWVTAATPCSIGSTFRFSREAFSTVYQKQSNHNIATATGIVNLWP